MGPAILFYSYFFPLDIIQYIRRLSMNVFISRRHIMIMNQLFFFQTNEYQFIENERRMVPIV